MVGEEEGLIIGRGWVQLREQDPLSDSDHHLSRMQMLVRARIACADWARGLRKYDTRGGAGGGSGGGKVGGGVPWRVTVRVCVVVRGVLCLCADFVWCAGMCVRGRGCGSAFAPYHEMLGGMGEVEPLGGSR